MRAHFLTFLLLAVAVVENVEVEDLTQGVDKAISPKLFVLDDDENLVEVVFKATELIPDLALNVDDRVKFYLHTRVSMVEKELFVDDVETLRKSTFDPKRETKFVTHGWINSKRSAACRLVKDAFLKRGDYNVIVVDWSAISTRPYGFAASNVLNVAKRVSKMIDFLANNGMDLNTTTVVGHSLGAHIAGLSAYYSKGQVNYVVGLDPALPLFALKGPGHRISLEDAKNVEIIHTNAGLLGYLTPIGMADFYPNGGSRQKGCIVDIGGSCSHARSFKLFSESLVSESGFYGKRCKSIRGVFEKSCDGDVGVMGGPKPYLPFRGTYYLVTKEKAPYALGAGVY